MPRKRHKFDPVLTAERNYLDKRSYCTIDGKEFLFGPDMTYRRSQVYQRDQGLCGVCRLWVRFEDMEADHFPVSRGRGGDDSMGNLRTIHPHCHRNQHIQVRWSAQKAGN